MTGIGVESFMKKGFVVKEELGNKEHPLRELAFSLDMDMGEMKRYIDILKDIEQEIYEIRDEMDEIDMNLNAEIPEIMRMMLKFKDLHRPIRILNESFYYTVQNLDRSYLKGRERVDELFYKVVKRQKRS